MNESRQVIFYTNTVPVTSRAVYAIYYDDMTNSLYFQFPNGTVSRRPETSINSVLFELNQCDGSAGRMWNEVYRDLDQGDTYRGNIAFVEREPQPDAASNLDGDWFPAGEEPVVERPESEVMANPDAARPRITVTMTIAGGYSDIDAVIRLLKIDGYDPEVHLASKVN